MPRAELTRMGIALAVALVAMSYLAIDAGFVDINSGTIAKRIETAQASLADAAMSQHQLASAVQAWTHRGHQKPQSAIE
ncbi:hypothetical protein [Bradyrhizobium guangzhouense]|uniref:Uncharacterized protein n=1 Tax=Bradyrhizobium guangzhouense TaxID=1325095 RepID=A0AAE5X1K7_9BRAD|nr:hypothetical protein [Bradyrhizobium guangzhouense]QAU47182.1 hypothetical protein XH91_18710 [Bradyrhizobium guangzhouense]RXH13751.1 hypothetical protein EAS56_14265 [Bradyrhizobium guangzhouense]